MDIGEQQLEGWFDLPWDTDKGEILVRLLDDGEEKDALEQMAFFETVYVTNEKGEQVRELRERKIGDKRYLRACMAVKDWRNVQSGGKDVPCTPENVVMACRKDQRFDNRVAEALKLLKTQRDEKRGAETKNSSSGVAGSPE